MLFGRDAERALIGALLDAARRSRSGALALRGEPGVGKTALLEDARERAGDFHVLAARGVESEAELPFAALHQLLRPALGQLGRLAVSQAAALRSAFGLAGGDAHERFVVYSACLSLLSELAEERPVLCLVDDAHWLDAGSADALRFVARRLDAEGVVLLFSAREGDVRQFEAADVPVHAVGGLDDAAAAGLLAQVAGSAAARVRDLLLEQTRGNALALVELPLALSAAQLAGDEPLPESLPMTRRLESVFHARVARLPQATQIALLVAAADDSESAAVVARAGGDALAAAEQAGLVTIAGDRLRFRHPLVRSAVYGSAASSERRAAHAALAAALAGDAEHADRRAWHLASAALAADASVVHALEETAQRAVERGAHVAAAKALERAAALSAEPAERARRLVRAASLTSLAGRDRQAVALADRAAPLTEDAVLRAELAAVQSIAAHRHGRVGDSIPALVEAARAVAAADRERAVELLSQAASAARHGGDRPALLEIARVTAAVAPPEAEGPSAFVARVILGFAALVGGDPAAAAPLLERALAWGAISDDARYSLLANLCAIWLGDDEAADALVRRSARLARARGEIGTLAEALAARAAQLFLAQRYDEAALAAAEASELARELDAENLVLLPHAVLTVIAAVRGDDKQTRRHAEELIALATAKAQPTRAAIAAYALALGDLGHGRWTEALDRLDAMAEQGTGAVDPVMAALMLPDKIEAAVRAGRSDAAREWLPLFEAWATHAATPAAQPRLASCRALVAEGDAATRHYEDALALAGDARPFDLARIQLLYGEHLRREHRRTEARTRLRAAISSFEALRAEPWAERARAELRATGETARRRDPSTLDQLTPQELHIARLVASGLANKEVAAQLFLSPRTVDAHLRKVFTKLGVNSRTQLARLPLAEEQPAAEPSLI